jgi:hypothetical protein
MSAFDPNRTPRTLFCDLNGFPYQSPLFPPTVASGLVFDLYLTKDGRWVLPTGGYPHMINEWCSLLRCPPDKASIAHVCFWHKADMAITFRNVRFLVNSGHHSNVVR